MTKTIKICDKCGKECGWLFIVPFMRIKGKNLEILNDTPMGTANNGYCEECTRKIIDKIDDIVLHQKF